MTLKQPKHLLVLVGLSPAVASETYYALRRQGDVVGAISIITTAAGIAKAKERLDGRDGAISAINALRFSPDDGVIDPPSLRFIDLNDQNHRPMDDLLNPKDHEAMVRIINQTVLNLTEDEAPPLHASLAGGRKTMAGALGPFQTCRF
jgi:CRISPR-associated protein (TIGR02584 family)